MGECFPKGNFRVHAGIHHLAACRLGLPYLSTPHAAPFARVGEGSEGKNVNQSVAYAREGESDIVRTSSEVVFPTSEKNETTSEINFTPSEENKCFQTIL